MLPSVGPRGDVCRLRVRNGCLRWASTIVLLAMTAVIAFAAEVTLFGPETFTRRHGRPGTTTRTFRVNKPPDHAVLRVENHGVTDAVIWINGRSVLEPDDFRRRHVGPRGYDCSSTAANVNEIARSQNNT